MKKILSIFAILALSLSLSACGLFTNATDEKGNNKLLQEAADEANKELPAIEEQSGGLFKASVAVEGNSLVYDFIISAEITESSAYEEFKVYLEEAVDTGDLSTLADEPLKIFEDLGIKDSSVIIRFVDDSDELILERTYTLNK